MTAPPARNTLSGTPTNAQFNAGIGALYDYTVGLLGAAGTPAAARAALGAVGLTGNETIAGVKTFTSQIVASGGVQGNVTGNVTGNATTVTNGVYTTGNQTIAGVKTFSSAPVVPDDSFTFAKLQNIATATILGRSTAGTGDVEALTGAQAAALLPMRTPIQPISASVAANALTLTLNPTTLDFRSDTLGNGTVNTRTVAAALNLTVPSGATLGTINAVASRIALLAIDNAGTVELAAVNMVGGVNLDETRLISTTAISGTSNSATVVYSQTARTNAPFRVVGYVESTQTTAGTWATAPSLVQGQGGQAMAAMQSLGFGQTWQNVTGSRVAGTTYYNTTGKPINIAVALAGGGGVSASIAVAGVQTGNSSGSPGTLYATVPPGGSYVLTNSGTTITAWSELR